MAFPSRVQSSSMGPIQQASIQAQQAANQGAARAQEAAQNAIRALQATINVGYSGDRAVQAQATARDACHLAQDTEQQAIRLQQAADEAAQRVAAIQLQHAHAIPAPKPGANWVGGPPVFGDRPPVGRGHDPRLNG